MRPLNDFLQSRSSGGPEERVIVNSNKAEVYFQSSADDFHLCREEDEAQVLWVKCERSFTCAAQQVLSASFIKAPPQLDVINPLNS
ncbi:hypothetical protein Q8A67_021876 [Cirrhinus molitorella]|uniref:Uncharacterized protein n=1 Tax=Cirrhinus molitorella TaxID=172907 RepID=A0AA88TN57_9TELE|nr:hypothetical protein Q8A67_021876 [Cirrhinus molitorella]